MKHSLTETFDIEFPLFAFSHCRDVVAAVSRNGGFGGAGGGGMAPPKVGGGGFVDGGHNQGETGWAGPPGA